MLLDAVNQNRNLGLRMNFRQSLKEVCQQLKTQNGIAIRSHRHKQSRACEEAHKVMKELLGLQSITITSYS